MKLNKTLLIAALSLFAVSGLMAKDKPKKEEIPGVAPQPAEFFYTGKPYDKDLGAYTFNYRNYDPSTARWTSADPSGFPDGANNRIYAPVPTVQLDPNGLAKMTSYQGTLNWYDGKPRPETFTETFSDYYSDVKYQPTDFDGFLTQFSSASNGTTIDIVKNYNRGDAYAIGRGNLELSGSVSVYPSGTKLFDGYITLQDDVFNFDSRPWG